MVRDKINYLSLRLGVRLACIRIKCEVLVGLGYFDVSEHFEKLRMCTTK